MKILLAIGCYLVALVAVLGALRHAWRDASEADRKEDAMRRVNQR